MQRVINGKPAVSVIIPNYNHALYLHERIEFVLSQTFSDFELIILDDASTDNSREIIEGYAREDRRISFYPSKTNSGSPFVQWNRGVGLAKANLIWIAESDDVASPFFLHRLLEIHASYPEIALAFCQSNRMNGSGEITGTWKTFTDPLNKELFESDYVYPGMQFIQELLIHKNVIPNASAVVFKKEVYQEVQGADEKLRTNSDWLTWLKMLVIKDVAFVAAPLNNFRYHPLSVIARLESSKGTDYQEKYDLTMRKAFEDYCNASHIAIPFDLLKINKQYRAYDFAGKGIHEMKKGDVIKGLLHVLHASLFPKPTFGYFRRLLKSKVLF